MCLIDEVHASSLFPVPLRQEVHASSLRLAPLDLKAGSGSVYVYFKFIFGLFSVYDSVSSIFFICVNTLGLRPATKAR